MNWPWVSRRAYDELARERDWLRHQLERSREHARRVERAENGLPELEPQPRKPREPMPKKVKELIDRYETPSTRAWLREHASKLYARTGNWDAVADRLKQ